ncbi:MAG: hypothetical protein ACXWEY_11135, partial [Bacteroidia bacterium]
MKKKTSILFFLFTMFAGFCVAQESEDQTNFEDTIQFTTLSKFTTKNIDTLNVEILDTLTDPKIFIIHSHHKYSSNLLIAQQKNNAWTIYKVVEDFPEIERIERLDFNKKGSKEIIIYYSYRNGLSFYTHGWQEQEKGFLILDPDNFTLLADIKNYSYRADWSYEYDPDESDTIPFEDRTPINSESNSDCENYLAEISARKITLTKYECY